MVRLWGCMSKSGNMQPEYKLFKERTVAMKIVAGMDLGSERVQVCTMDEASRVLANQRMSWEPGRWKSWVEALGGAEQVEVAFECGPDAYRAKRILDALEVKSYPFHARSFRLMWGEKKKSDKIDARKIAGALRREGLPRRVELAEDRVAVLRNLVSERRMYQKIKQQLQNRVRGMSRQWGVELPKYEKNRTEQWWCEAGDCFEGAQRQAMARMTALALVCQQNLERIDDETEYWVEQAGLKENYERLLSLPGFGPVVASGVVAFLGDGHRFSSGKKWIAYVGFAPEVEQTGKGPARIGHIRKEGPSVVRWSLVLAAQAAAHGHQLDGTRWKEKFRRQQAANKRKVGIVELASRLGKLAYAVIRDQSQWDPHRLQRTTALK